MGRLNYVRRTSDADTAACLLIRKEIYDEVGGLDESYAVASTMWTSASASRQAGYTKRLHSVCPALPLREQEPRHGGQPRKSQKRFQGGGACVFRPVWGDLLAAGDPCTNPNFDIQREDFSLKILPLE